MPPGRRCWLLVCLVAVIAQGEGECEDDTRLCNALVDFAECLEGRFCQFHTHGMVIERVGAQVPVFCTALDATSCSFRNCEDVIARAEEKCTEQSNYKTVDASLIRLSKEFCEKHGMSCRDLAVEKAEDEANAKEEAELKKATEEATKKAEEEAKVEDEKEEEKLLTEQILAGNMTSHEEMDQKQKLLEDVKKAEQEDEEEVDKLEEKETPPSTPQQTEAEAYAKEEEKEKQRKEHKMRKKQKKYLAEEQEEEEQKEESCEDTCSTAADKCFAGASSDPKKQGQCTTALQYCIVQCSSEVLKAASNTLGGGGNAECSNACSQKSLKCMTSAVQSGGDSVAQSKCSDEAAECVSGCLSTATKLLSTDGQLSVDQASEAPPKNGPSASMLVVCGVIAVVGIAGVVLSVRRSSATIEDSIPIAAVASL